MRDPSATSGGEFEYMDEGNEDLYEELCHCAKFEIVVAL